jgi:hypothetical protein
VVAMLPPPPFLVCSLRPGPGHAVLTLAAVLIVAAGLPGAQAQCELCQTGLKFIAPVAGKAVPMIVQLRFKHKFVQGDSVVLKLPGFIRDAGSTTAYAAVSALDGDGNPSPAFTAASWDEAGKLLTLHHINPIQVVANTLLRVTVPKNIGVRLPGGGAVANSTEYKIRAAAVAAATEFEPLKQTEPVGVLYNSSVTFEPALPLTTAALTLNFTLSIRMDAGENATLELPSFTVNRTSVVTCGMVVCSNIWDLRRTCSEGSIDVEVSTRGASVMITLMLADTVRDLESVTVTVPTSAGITTPAFSAANNYDLLLASKSLAGPVLPAPVEASNEIPRYSLFYRPAKAATGECASHDLATGSCTAWQSEQAELNVNIVLDRAIAPGQQVLLQLPGFSRKVARQSLPTAPIDRQCSGASCDSTIVPLGSSSNFVPSAQWNESKTTLTFALNASLPSNWLVSVTIPASAGLHLPITGVALVQTSISFEHVEAAVQNAPVNPYAPAVGAFVRSSAEGSLYASSGLLLMNDRAGAVAGRLNFTFTAGLATSQCVAFCGTKDHAPLPFSVKREIMGPVTLILTLPGFSRAGGNLDHFEIPHSPNFAHASWIESSSTLVLTATGANAGGTLVSVPIPQGAGISLPVDGVTRNSARLRIATNSLAGPVINTSIGYSTAIGSITDASVSFSPSKAGVPVTITLSFSFSQYIAAREYFTVTLPGFARPHGLAATFAISATVDGVTRPLWGEWFGTGTDPKLRMTAGAGGFAGNTKIRAVVSQSEQIFLRESGMPQVVARKYWRVVNNSAVKHGWSVAELRLYSDSACTKHINTPLSVNALGSSGAGTLATGTTWENVGTTRPAAGREIVNVDLANALASKNNFTQDQFNAFGVYDLRVDDFIASDASYFKPALLVPMTCNTFVYSTGPCPSGYRRARFAEIAGCKLALCHIGARPEYLVAQGDGAYFLGAGYGCMVLTGNTTHTNADSICLPRVASAYNAFDNQSASSWVHFADANSSEIYVGMQFETLVSVQCAMVEQERFDDNWAVSSVALQSSADGVHWATVFEGSVAKGSNVLHRPKGALGSNGFSSITMSSSAVRGPCENVRVGVAMPIGSFSSSSSLAFGTPAAGGISNITLSVTPEMEIDVGETISVRLNGFTGNKSDSLHLLARYHAPVFDSELSELCKDPGINVCSGEDGSKMGVVSDACYALWAKYAGDVPACANIASKELVTPECKAALGIPCQAGYSFVELFSYNPRSAAPSCESPGSCSGNNSTLPLFNASWDPDSYMLTIRCGAVMYAGQRLMVTVLERNELRLPATGIASSVCGTGATVEPNALILANSSSVACGKCAGCAGINENTITIGTNARSGPVVSSPPTVVRTIQRIGSFFNTSINFSALTNAYPVNITVQFTYSFDLIQGDQIYLHLPKFKGASTAGVPTFGTHAKALAKASWDVARSILAIAVTDASIPALTSLQISIPASAKVVLRGDGLEKNSSLLQISSNAVNGPVHPKAFDSSPAMGSFTTGEPTRISYIPGEFKGDGSPYMEGRISALSVGFALNRDISVGEHIFLRLIGFSRKDDVGVLFNASVAKVLDSNFSTVDTSGVFSSFLSASWHESDQVLTLTSSKDILAHQRHVVLIPSSAGLRLPLIGLRENDQRLTIGTNAVKGPNSGTPIAHSPGLNEVCGAECGAWAYTCGTCRCGPCASKDSS